MNLESKQYSDHSLTAYVEAHIGPVYTVDYPLRERDSTNCESVPDHIWRSTTRLELEV